MSTNTSSKKILVVEDEAFLRDIYVEILKDEGYVVESASDGEEAFNKMSEGGYDLVLLDIILPKKDGLQILRDLKKTPPKSENKAIIVLSNLGQEAVISEGVELGIRGHIVKSDYTPDQLVEEVERIINA